MSDTPSAVNSTTGQPPVKLDPKAARAAAREKKLERKQRFDEAMSILRSKKFNPDLAVEFGEWLEGVLIPKAESKYKSGRTWLTKMMPYIKKCRKGAYTYDEIASALNDKFKKFELPLVLTGTMLEIIMEPQNFKDLKPKRKKRVATPKDENGVAKPESATPSATPAEASATPTITPTPAVVPQPVGQQAGPSASSNGVTPSPEAVPAPTPASPQGGDSSSASVAVTPEKTEAKVDVKPDVRPEPPPIPLKGNKMPDNKGKGDPQKPGVTQGVDTRRRGGMFGLGGGNNQG